MVFDSFCYEIELMDKIFLFTFQEEFTLTLEDLLVMSELGLINLAFETLYLIVLFILATF